MRDDRKDIGKAQGSLKWYARTLSLYPELGRLWLENKGSKLRPF